MTDAKVLPMPPRPTSAATLIKWRKRMGDLSQRNAARALGCSPTAFWNWENGTSEVPPYIGLAMAALSEGLPPYR
jgi:DNA-binding XRE family transcriptional regulator